MSFFGWKKKSANNVLYNSGSDAITTTTLNQGAPPKIKAGVVKKEPKTGRQNPLARSASDVTKVPVVRETGDAEQGENPYLEKKVVKKEKEEIPEEESGSLSSRFFNYLGISTGTEGEKVEAKPDIEFN